MTKDEALKLALEALEQLQGGCTDHDDGTVEAITVWCPEVIDAIKQALAQPEQEPVAYLFTNVQSNDIESSTDPDHKQGERELWFREALVRPAQEPEERNFCQRCGKRTNDIHTCTPPMEKNT